MEFWDRFFWCMHAQRCKSRGQSLRPPLGSADLDSTDAHIGVRVTAQVPSMANMHFFLTVLLVVGVHADEWERFEEARWSEAQEHTREQDVEQPNCTKTAPCWEHNLTACFELRTPLCWTHHTESGTFPCTQADPCCADDLCWFRHAPEKGLVGNDLFTVRRVFAAASVCFVFYLACESVIGVTIFEYFKLLIVLNVLGFLGLPHPWFHTLCIPFFPHPNSSLKFLLSYSKMVIPLVGFKRLDLLARIVFGMNWRGRIWRLAQAPRGEAQGDDSTGAREQLMHWPPPLRVAESVTARLQTGDLAPPEPFICPLTFDLMREPTVTPRGTTYEREALTRWITAEGRFPLLEANGNLGVEQLAPNLTVRNLIEVWLQEQDGGKPRAASGQGKAKKRAKAKQGLRAQ